ncbi:MAG TPA: phage tail protein [Candidatus Avoscillospira stercoripullorum]|uniref:Phage tail protein n=1 Tax=Candidatus Avoscillospira stercoripullorum TaxID=2840709 RepID=A0A9D1A9M0_9FIRM|nr:phage tail protein [Candidatus Avoscillospira stercoripullorum]
MGSLNIYSGSVLQCSFPRVLSASLSDKLSGERTLEFSVLASRSQSLSVGMTAELDGQYYNIVRISKQITGGFPVTTAQCEHISYILNDVAYNLVTFVFEGTPTAGLTELLSGTPFSVGTVEATERVEAAFTDQSPLSRRNALMRFIDACGCEVEYDGYVIHLRKHRGSTVRKPLMDGENVTNLSVTIDGRENTAAYEISLFKMADLQAGDEVNITYTPMGIQADTRIVSIQYNPFYRYTVRVEVGDYVPNLMASSATQLDRIRQEFRAADGRLESTIESVDGELSQLTQTVSGFDLRIATAEGAVSELSLTVGGFDTRIADAEGAVSVLSQTVSGFDTRIEDAEGSVSALSQSLTSITTRIETAEGNISTVTQTADKINWLIASGTSSSNFTMTDRAISLVADTIDLSGYVTISALETAGKTTINGSNITTGTIHADRIDTSTLKVKTIYATSGKVSLTEYSSNNMYIGGDGTWNYSYTYIFAGSQIKLASWDGVGTHALIFDTSNHCVRPATTVDWDLGNVSYPFGKVWCESVTIRNIGNDGFIGFNGGTFEIVASGSSVNRLGSSTYYWDTGYISKLYLSSSCYLSASGSNLQVNGTTIGGDTNPNMAGKEVRMGGSTTYYITATTGRQLRPSSSSSYYAFYLGTSSYYWHYAYIGSNTVKLGSSTSSKLGFFSATPVTRQTVSSSATVATLISALKKYGLIG